MRLVGRRGHHPVDAALQEAIRQKGERVCDIHGNGAWVRLHVLPLVCRSADLQRRDGLTEEKRQAAEVGMTFHPNAGEGFVNGGGAAVVLHVAEVTVAVRGVAVDLEKVVFVQPEDDCDEGEEFVYDGLVDVFAEFVDGWPRVEDDLWVWAIVRWDCFRNVVDFSVIKNPRRYFADSFRLVSVVTPILEVGAVLEFFFSREVEEGLPDSELFVDLFLREAKVGYVEEANLIDGVE